MKITFTRDTSTITESIKPSYFNYVAQDENIDERRHSQSHQMSLDALLFLNRYLFSLGYNEHKRLR